MEAETDHDIPAGDQFRTPETCMAPDFRQQFFKRFGEDGRFQPIELRHYYDWLCGLKLHDNVPLDYRIAFENARNLMLYSWFVYRFAHVAELEAIATLEWALRDKLGAEAVKRNGASKPLSQLLPMAGKRGMIAGGALARRGYRGHTDEEYLRLTCEMLVRARNKRAHKTPSLHPQTARQSMSAVCELLNDLFVRDPNGKRSPPPAGASAASAVNSPA